MTDSELIRYAVSLVAFKRNKDGMPTITVRTRFINAPTEGLAFLRGAFLNEVIHPRNKGYYEHRTSVCSTLEEDSDYLLGGI